MRSNQLVRGLVYAFFVATVFTGCMSEGGLNQNERQAGGGDEGVAVEQGEIAIDPTGQYLISKLSTRLVHADLRSGETKVLPGLSQAVRVTFDHQGTSLFVTRSHSRLQLDDEDDDSPSIGLGAGELVRYDVAQRRELWSLPITLELGRGDQGLGAAPWLDVTEDDRFVVVTYPDRVDVLDATTGERKKTVHVPEGVIDVDVTPDQDRIVITTQHTWQDDVPRTVLEVHELASNAVVEIAVPNCASELVISPSGQHGFLAPTRCQRDPVSVIDLESGRFVRNLPGFGPVALAPDGKLAVAFIDATNIDEELFDDPQQIPSEEVRYHLMLIDTETLRFDVLALGEELPRYAITPDGKLVLIDASTLWSDGRIRLLDVAQKELVPVLGSGLHLDHYAVTRDSSKVFLLDDGLFTIDLSTRVAQSEPIEFTPTDLNLTPDDRVLVLREDSATLWLYDAKQPRVLRSITLPEQ
jgi:hypothetical protein